MLKRHSAEPDIVAPVRVNASLGAILPEEGGPSGVDLEVREAGEFQMPARVGWGDAIDSGWNHDRLAAGPVSREDAGLHGGRIVRCDGALGLGCADCLGGGENDRENQRETNR
jgi:hypothetical protein